MRLGPTSGGGIKTIRDETRIPSRLGLKNDRFAHIFGFKRHVFIEPDENNEYPDSFIIIYENNPHRFFLAGEMIKCKICKLNTHQTSKCPNTSQENIPQDNNLQENIPQIQIPKDNIPQTNIPQDSIPPETSTSNTTNQYIKPTTNTQTTDKPPLHTGHVHNQKEIKTSTANTIQKNITKQEFNNFVNQIPLTSTPAIKDNNLNGENKNANKRYASLSISDDKEDVEDTHQNLKLSQL